MISAVILTKNSERTLEKTLSSLQSFPEVILVDTGSQDKTFFLAGKFSNVKLFKTSFTSFGALRNWGASLAKQEWILALDSDEYLSSSLVQEIHKTVLQEDNVYAFSFHNYFRGKHMKCCGWHPEFHIRLYRKKKTFFVNEELHERLCLTKLKTSFFKNPIVHTPYLEIGDFLRKMELYTTLFAKQHRGKKKSSFSRALFHASFAFFKSYFFKRGLFFGSRGFILASYQASSAFYKYLKLAEENKNNANHSSIS